MLIFFVNGFYRS